MNSYNKVAMHSSMQAACECHLSSFRYERTLRGEVKEVIKPYIVFQVDLLRRSLKHCCRLDVSANCGCLIHLIAYCGFIVAAKI